MHWFNLLWLGLAAFARCRCNVIYIYVIDLIKFLILAGNKSGGRDHRSTSFACKSQLSLLVVSCELGRNIWSD